MANLQLNPGESRIGQGLVSYRDLEKHTYQCWHATIYVTNQRVFLDTYTGIELKLSKIRGFTFGRILLFFPSVTIFGQAEKTVIGEHGLTEDAYIGCANYPKESIFYAGILLYNQIGAQI